MRKGLIYAIFASVLWAIVNPFIKQGLSYDFTPMNFAGLRFTLAGVLVIVGMSAAQRRPLVPQARDIKPIFVLSLFQTIGQYFFLFLAQGDVGRNQGKQKVVSKPDFYQYVLRLHHLLFRG